MNATAILNISKSAQMETYSLWKKFSSMIVYRNIIHTLLVELRMRDYHEIICF